MCDVTWLFNAYVDGVVWDINVRMLAGGLSLVSAESREWNVSHLLFIDDVAFV